jgi:hypothetical protein
MALYTCGEDYHMAAKTELSELGIARLAEYYRRADLMHMHLHELRKLYDYQIPEDSDAWLQFRTYVLFWLSALFVVIEGFNKLKIKEPRVQRLFREHLNNLKAMRHETYHFVLEHSEISLGVIDQLNWAKELHETMGEYIGELVGRRLSTIEWRPRKRELTHSSPSAPRSHR